MNEIWKDIAGYEGFYQVSNFGRVKSLFRFRHCGHPGAKPHLLPEKLLTPRKEKKGYLSVGLCKNSILTFKKIPNPDNKTETNHKDRDKTNNHVSNLEWSTTLENVRHAELNGGRNQNKGIMNPKSKLRESDIVNIRNRAAKGETTTKIASDYGVDKSNICYIIKRKTWKHVK